MSYHTEHRPAAEEEKWNKSSLFIKRFLFGAFISPTIVATVDRLLLPQFTRRHSEMLK
jgi:hypothetical protein